MRAEKAGEGRGATSDDDDTIARRYHSMVINRRPRAAGRWVTSWSGRGVLSPADIDLKTGRPVIDVLRDKHPVCNIPGLEQDGWASFEEYLPPRDAIPLDCDQETVQVVGNKPSGGAGPLSVDGVALKQWLLRYGNHSQVLREKLAVWIEWMSNVAPPWAAYCALQTCRLAALDKQPGVLPVGIGEI